MKLLQLLGKVSFYAYLASLFGLGLFGLFLPETELGTLYHVRLDGLEPAAKVVTLHQYRILKAFVVGFAVFAAFYRREIFRVRRYNFLFLFTMFAEVLARPLSMWRDGMPGSALVGVTITEAVFAVCIFASSRTQLEEKGHPTSPRPEPGRGEPRSTQSMSHCVGISFSEVMRGGFALQETDPKAGKKAGERSGNELAIHADVKIDDIDSFVADPNHLGGLSGSIDFTPFGDGLQGTSGVFNLFNPTENPKLKLMVYELGFEHGGKSYYFAGKKEVRDDFGLDLWSDTTTLYSQLHEGTDKSGPVVGAGTLTLGVRDLISLLKTVDTPGSQSKTEAAAAINKFGKFFLAELWDTYVIHCKKA